MLGRFAGHVALLACWVLVAVMAVLTWGPHATRYKTDIIVGQSMEPTIPLYSVIVVEPTDPARIAVGDVITFQQPDSPERKVTHRVVRIGHRGDGALAFSTKGDNNDVRDPWRVTYADTGYVVRAHAPHVGWLMIQAQTRWARILLIALPVLLLLVSFLRWVWRDEELDEDPSADAGDHDVEADADVDDEPAWDLPSWPRDRSAA
ncbi:MAG: sipW 2 [Thermoleophilia bacterium]|nr:sipW 2 [Thermoleophilia bacterium]